MKKLEDFCFTIPRSCLLAIGELFSGEYKVPAAFNFQPTILDIGANVGGFAMWAAYRLGAKSITCYEPNRQLLPILKHNVSGLPCPVEVHGVGVGDPDLDKLYQHGDRPVLYSQYPTTTVAVTPMVNQKTISIDVIHPSKLLFHHIVKIDTEGAEGFICSHLPFTPVVLLVEYHTDKLRLEVEQSLASRMYLAESAVRERGVGILKYIKREPTRT